MILRLLLIFPVALLQYIGQTTNGHQNYNLHENQYDLNQKEIDLSSINGYDFRRGVVKQILTPYNITSNDNTLINSGVTIQFQLRGYSNPSSALPNGWTCICPVGATCSYLKSLPACYIGFTFIISSPDTSVRHVATDFITLDSNGQLSKTQQNNWDQNYVVQLPSKPSAIDIFAHHLGTVINAADGNIVSVDTLTHVDTFVVPLSEALPAVDGVQSMSQQHSFSGKLLGTTLILSYSIACSGSLIGRSCDLTCNQSHINQNVAACRSNITGFFMVCSYQSGGQVDNCKNCPWGLRENTYCQDEDGLVLDPHHSGVVDTSYKTATIILAIISIILFLLTIIALAAVFFLRRSQHKDKEMTIFARSEGGAAHPLLHASFRSDSGPPTPLPRSQPPSLDAKPMKSALRKPMAPPAHLNNTRDTSLSSDVPVRPSRSEVV